MVTTKPYQKEGVQLPICDLRVKVHYQTIIHIQTGICFISNPRVNGGTCMKGVNKNIFALVMMITLDNNVKASRAERLCMRTNLSLMNVINTCCCYNCYLIIKSYVLAVVLSGICKHKEGICLNDCNEMHVGGIYASCQDCQRYLTCNGRTKSGQQCSNTPKWGFNVDNRQCQHKSSHCVLCNGKLHLSIKST